MIPKDSLQQFTDKIQSRPLDLGLLATPYQSFRSDRLAR